MPQGHSSSFGIWRLMYAMAAHEGWQKPDPAIGFGGSKSYRYNNPGNLRASPFIHSTFDGFCAFSDEFTGWAAFKYDIEQKAKGNTTTGLNGNSTIRDLIYKWAPPGDNNNTEAYLQDVVLKSGLSGDTQLKTLVD